MSDFTAPRTFFTPTIFESQLLEARPRTVDFDEVYSTTLRVLLFKDQLDATERDMLERQMNVLETVRFHTASQTKLPLRVSEVVYATLLHAEGNTRQF